MDRDQITRSLDLHRYDKETSVEDYIERLQRQLGLKLTSRQAIYLDTRYWIFLRDVVLGRPQKPAHTQLLSRLRQRVLSGAVFCPISSATFAELLSQTVPASRLITAGIVDELSLGVALRHETARVHTEIFYLLCQAELSHLPPLRSTAWTKVAYVLGAHYPTMTAFGPEDERMLQKAFTDHLWGARLSDMVPMLGDAPDVGFGATAERLNALNREHAADVKSFRETYLAEISGTLDLFVPYATDVVQQHFPPTARPTPTQQADRASLERAIYTTLVDSARSTRAAEALPTLHAQAMCFAAIRYDQRRRLKGNDLLDFHHAVGALAYCNAFFTDRPLSVLLTSNPLALHKSYPCAVTSDKNEALALVESLGSNSGPAA